MFTLAPAKDLSMTCHLSSLCLVVCSKFSSILTWVLVLVLPAVWPQTGLCQLQSPAASPPKVEAMTSALCASLDGLRGLNKVTKGWPSFQLPWTSRYWCEDLLLLWLWNACKKGNVLLAWGVKLKRNLIKRGNWIFKLPHWPPVCS